MSKTFMISDEMELAINKLISYNNSIDICDKKIKNSYTFINDFYKGSNSKLLCNTIDSLYNSMNKLSKNNNEYCRIFKKTLDNYKIASKNSISNLEGFSINNGD